MSGLAGVGGITKAKLITVLAIAFLLLLDGRRIANWCLDRLPPDQAPRAREVCRRIYPATGGYIAGNLLISVVAGTVSFVTLVALNWACTSVRQ